MGEYVPKDSDLHKQLTKSFNFDRKVRGEYLIQTTFVESFMSEIIAYHFVPYDKKNHSLFLSLILGDIRFADKIRIFSHLIETYYPEIKKKYPTIRKDLEEVRDFRNKLAHYIPETKSEYVSKYYKDRIRLSSYKSGKEKSIEITKKKFKKDLSLCREVTEILADIGDDLYDRMNGTLSKEKYHLYNSK